MTVAERLAQFEPTNLSEEASLDTSLADDFLKAFTRMARAQAKTQQAVALSVDDVKRALQDQQSLIEEVKEQRRNAERKNEQLVRFLLEAVDLVFNLERSAVEADNTELLAVSQTMTRALRASMDKVGLTVIPAHGEEPDALCHFVVGTRPAEHPSQKERIVDVVKQGYILDGTVIRKADVIVGL